MTKSALTKTAHGRVVEIEAGLRYFHIMQDGQGAVLNVHDGTHWFQVMLFGQAYDKLMRGEWVDKDGDTREEHLSLTEMYQANDLITFIKGGIRRFRPVSHIRVTLKGVYRHITKDNPCDRTGKAPKKAGEVWRELICNFADNVEMDVITNQKNQNIIADMMTPAEGKSGYGQPEHSYDEQAAGYEEEPELEKAVG